MDITDRETVIHGNVICENLNICHYHLQFCNFAIYKQPDSERKWYVGRQTLTSCDLALNVVSGHIPQTD